MTYVAWRGGNGVFSKWHIAQNAVWTFCGKPTPSGAQRTDSEQRSQADDTCRICRQEYLKNLRIGAI